MADTFFYPHTLQLDIDGTFVTQFECRDQPNASGSVVSVDEKTNYVYKSVIFFPKSNTYRFVPGEDILILGEDGLQRLKGTIVKFDMGGLEDCRIWV